MNAIQKYFQYRQSLIDQYLKGDMTKKEYLQRNLDAVLSLNIKPFKNIDSIEKALFNYQYYNAFAKDTKMQISKNIDYDLQQIIHEKINYYYSKKDQATFYILRLSDPKQIEAYFIKVRSKMLKTKLIEIVLHDSNMILHTTNESILNFLRKEYLFSEETKHSIIESYINQRY